MKSRHTNEEIVAAYRETGSVWKAGRKLGLAGQTVHGRLRAVGHPVGGAWCDEEVQRLQELAGIATIGQIADEMGRSYAAIACKISEIGIGSRFGNRSRKIPRGAGFDKASVKKHIRELSASEIPISRWARQRGIHVDTLIRAIEKYDHQWWVDYRNAHSDLPEAVCPHCDSVFYPSNSRQVFCTRRCGAGYKVDQNYFGGKRSQTIGLAEGRCQICGRTPTKGLSSHHVLGKENDPDNDWLVALCSGCHNVVTALGGRDFDETQWEALVSFSWLRRHGATFDHDDVVHVTVEIDHYRRQDEDSA